MRTIYRILRVINDIRSISKGTYPKRLMRRPLYRRAGRTIRKFVK